MNKPCSHGRWESKLGVCALVLLVTIGLAARSAALEAKQSAQSIGRGGDPDENLQAFRTP